MNKCEEKVEYVCFVSDKTCKYFKQFKDVKGCCEYRDYDDEICTCKEAIEEAKGHPKRTPLPDGTLELTEEEKKEFIDLILWHQHYELESVAIVDDLLTIGRSNNGIHCDYIFSHSVKAILWLADRFNLEV